MKRTDFVPMRAGTGILPKDAKARKLSLLVRVVARFLSYTLAMSKEVGVNKGGTYTDPQGYVFQYDETKHKMVRQHRLVMEHLLGRPLHPWETVHHKDGKRNSNDPANLEIWLSKGHPTGKRLADLYTKDIERLALENWKLKLHVKQLIGG